MYCVAVNNIKKYCAQIAIKTSIKLCKNTSTIPYHFGKEN